MTYHIPAMLGPTIAGLNIHPTGTYVDCTFGGGGHSRAILKQLGPQGRLLSFDQDLEALENELRNWGSGEAVNWGNGELGNRGSRELVNRDLWGDKRWQFVHGNFRWLKNFLDYYGVQHIDGLMADLGVSFHHFDEAERGFSFRFAGPLDMRMNQHGGRSAADIVNGYTEEELSRVLYLYGEMKDSRQIARKIIRAREQAPVRTIDDLVPAATGVRREDIDGKPAVKKELTLLFQALRIEVNDELGALREMLMAAKDLLKPGGRIAILTYHSLEDRIVKNFLRSGNLTGEIEKDFYGNNLTPFVLIEKGRVADADEVERNPRSRSAKLRVAEKK